MRLLFHTFLVLYFHCIVLPLFCTFVVSNSRCCSLSLWFTFVVSYFSCFIFSLFCTFLYAVPLLFCTFVVSQFFVSHGYCFSLLLFITFLVLHFQFQLSCSPVYLYRYTGSMFLILCSQISLFPTTSPRPPQHILSPSVFTLFRTFVV